MIHHHGKVSEERVRWSQKLKLLVPGLTILQTRQERPTILGYKLGREADDIHVHGSDHLWHKKQRKVSEKQA